MNKDFYIKNRKKIENILPNNTVVVLFAGRDICESEDEAYPFTVNRSFYYFTGVNEQNDILLIANVDGDIRTQMFINTYDEREAKWIGRKLFSNEIEELSGIKKTAYLKDFKDIIQDYASAGFTIWLDVPEKCFPEPQGEAYELQKSLTEQGFKVKNCYNDIAQFRMVKEPEEIEEIRKGIHITNLGIQEMLKNIKPGLYEYQLESFFDQQLKFNGASGHSFKTIAASGANGCVLHYSSNNSLCNDGDLILFDLGAASNIYKADISRTFPLNGKFTYRQKQVYNIVLACQQKVFEHIRPGMTTRDLNQIVIDFYAVELQKLGLISNRKDVSKYYFHGVSHHLGLDTHDVTDFSKKLEVGNVITNEPGLYIPEWNIGIRIEDDILVTEFGAENLSSEIIKKPEDIENFILKYQK